VEVAVIQKARQRVGLSLMLELRAALGVVERERGCVAEALRELELVLVELRVVADSVDVQRALELTSRDERHHDERLGIDRRSLDDANARIEVSLVRVHGLAVLDGPAGDARPEGRFVVDDLLRPFAADEHGDELAAGGVGLVDHELVVRHQRTNGVGDALEQRIEALLGEHVAKDVGQAAIRLDEGTRARERVRRVDRGQADRRRGRAFCSVLGAAHGCNLGPFPQ
jgi:hypothetical protein